MRKAIAICSILITACIAIACLFLHMEPGSPAMYAILFILAPCTYVTACFISETAKIIWYTQILNRRQHKELTRFYNEFNKRMADIVKTGRVTDSKLEGLEEASEMIEGLVIKIERNLCQADCRHYIISHMLVSAVKEKRATQIQKLPENIEHNLEHNLGYISGCKLCLTVAGYDDAKKKGDTKNA